MIRKKMLQQGELLAASVSFPLICLIMSHELCLFESILPPASFTVHLVFFVCSLVSIAFSKLMHK